MRKRHRDEWPQYLVFSATQSSTDAATTTRIPMPLAPYDTSGEIIEALRLRFDVGGLLNDDDSAGTVTRTRPVEISVGLTTKANGVNVDSRTNAGPYYNADPFCFFNWTWDSLGALTSGAGSQIQTVDVDLTTMGRGHPIVTPNIYITINTAGIGRAVVRGKLFYRKVKMPMSEWLGFFQSQQSAT